MKITQDDRYLGTVRSVVRRGNPVTGSLSTVRKVYVHIPLQALTSPFIVMVPWNTRARGPAPIVGETVRVRFEVNMRSGISRWVIPSEDYISRPGSNPCSEIKLKEEGVCILSTNTMSYDRVRFFIGNGYCKDQYQRDSLRDVLKKSFDLGEGRSSQYMSGNYGGFYIICRPSQFARFMIFRNAAGIRNGFMDLQAKLYVPEPKLSPIEALAEKAGVNCNTAANVASALGLDGNDIKLAMETKGACADGPPEIDVSRNRYEPS